jgi:cytochrome b561
MTQQRFPALSRLLHWVMAAMILAMLFIGFGMVASLTDYRFISRLGLPCWPWSRFG